MSYRSISAGLFVVALAIFIFSRTPSPPDKSVPARAKAQVVDELPEAPESVQALGIARMSFAPRGWDGTRPQKLPTRDQTEIQGIFQEGARKRLGNGTVFMGSRPKRGSVSLDNKEGK